MVPSLHLRPPLPKTASSSACLWWLPSVPLDLHSLLHSATWIRLGSSCHQLRLGNWIPCLRRAYHSTSAYRPVCSTLAPPPNPPSHNGSTLDRCPYGSTGLPCPSGSALVITLAAPQPSGAALVLIPTGCASVLQHLGSTLATCQRVSALAFWTHCVIRFRRLLCSAWVSTFSVLLTTPTVTNCCYIVK